MTEKVQEQKMSTMQTRIADVYLDHTPSGAEGASLVNCWCGDRFDTFAHHAEHVAERLMDELGMTFEQRTLPDGMGGISTNWKTAETTVHSKPCTVQLRWVTRWEKAAPVLSPLAQTPNL